MKKLIGLSMFFLFVSFGAFAQSLELAKLTSNDNKKCVPTKECAEKMGMTLEECKKLCSTNKVASASAENIDAAQSDGKKSCVKTCKKSKVASASAENVNPAKLVNMEATEGKKKCAKKCMKKAKTTESEESN